MDVQFLGYDWKVEVLDTDLFQAKFGEDICGITDTDAKIITVNKKSLNLETVCHEITHVYCYYCCYSNCELTMDDMEELYCEIMAIHGEKIIKESKEIFDNLQKLG